MFIHNLFINLPIVHIIRNEMQQIEEQLKDVIALALNHIQILTKELHKLNITAENVAQASQADKDKAWMLNNVLFHINDIIHPVHSLAIDLFPDGKEFIAMCIENQKRAIAEGLLPSDCNCSSCKKG